MKQKRYSQEHIIYALKQVTQSGKRAKNAASLQVSEPTFCAWFCESPRTREPRHSSASWSRALVEVLFVMLLNSICSRSEKFNIFIGDDLP
jgi:hypothetical protein